MPFSKDLTVNDIIRSLKERKDRLENLPDRHHGIDIQINEIELLLSYIEQDGDYL